MSNLLVLILVSIILISVGIQAYLIHRHLNDIENQIRNLRIKCKDRGSKR